MIDLTRCFVPENKFTEAIKVTDVVYNEAGSPPSVSLHDVRGLEQLHGSLSEVQNRSHCRIMYVEFIRLLAQIADQAFSPVLCAKGIRGSHCRSLLL